MTIPVFTWIATAWNFLNATWLLWLGAGLLAAGLWNLWQWKADRALAREYARRSLEPVRLDSNRMVTVLVAAWNEAGNIQRLIESFRALRYPHKSMVLCAGGKDETYALACRLAGPDVTVLLQQPGEGKQRALRRGLDLARGEVIFLTDADCLLQDDSFERTLQPVLSGQEEVCTGTFHATFTQLRNVFAASQVVPQLYTALHAPEYSPGLSGCNCAVTRAALELSHGLDEPAPTGTDYVLAKMLTRAGVRIRQQSLSRMISAAPAGPRAYIRQQRRWMYNVFVHGRRFSAQTESRRALASSLLGIFMLAAPFTAPVVGPVVVAVWGTLFGVALFARLRYIGFARTAIRLPASAGLVLFQPLMLVIDFIAWARPLWDYLQLRKETAW